MAAVKEQVQGASGAAGAMEAAIPQVIASFEQVSARLATNSGKARNFSSLWDEALNPSRPS